MDFGWALAALKNGQLVARQGWNGKGMYLDLHEGIEDKDGDGYEIGPFIMIKTVGGTYVPWTASQTDMLAEDWGLV